MDFPSLDGREPEGGCQGHTSIVILLVMDVLGVEGAIVEAENLLGSLLFSTYRPRYIIGDCFVASAPRNDSAISADCFTAVAPRNDTGKSPAVIASKAKQSHWIEMCFYFLSPLTGRIAFFELQTTYIIGDCFGTLCLAMTREKVLLSLRA